MKLHFDVKFLSRQTGKVRLAKFTVLAPRSRGCRLMDACERLQRRGHVHGASDSWHARQLAAQQSEEGVFRRGHEKTGTAGFTRHTAIDAARLAVDEIAGV